MPIVPKDDVDRAVSAEGSQADADVVYVHGPTPDGQGLGILRVQGERVQVGELRQAKDGQPIHGELVSLTQRAEHERLFDVEVIARGPAVARAATQAPSAHDADHGAAHGASHSVSHGAGHKGPALVNSDAFRVGWDAVFGPAGRGQAN